MPEYAYATATQYTVSLLPETDINHLTYAITVDYRGHGQWAITRGRECLSRDGGWDWEPIPSERDDDWLAEHRFDLGTALRLAKNAAPGVVVNGRTAAEALARSTARQAAAADGEETTVGDAQQMLTRMRADAATHSLNGLLKLVSDWYRSSEGRDVLFEDLITAGYRLPEAP